MTGAYHFFSFDSDAKTQAQNYIRAVGNLSGHLIPAIDVEYYGSYIAHPKETEEVRAHLKELLTELETFYHVKPMIYTTPSAYRRYIKGAFEEYPLWIRNVYYHPSLLMLGRQWDLWQYTDRAQLGGYTGGTKYVDLNVFRKRKIDEYICP